MENQASNPFTVDHRVMLMVYLLWYISSLCHYLDKFIFLFIRGKQAQLSLKDFESYILYVNQGALTSITPYCSDTADINIQDSLKALLSSEIYTYT